MNAAKLIRVLNAFERENIPKPVSMVVDVKSFRELKADLSSAIFYNGEEMPVNQIKFHGVIVSGKLCDCGAHPEDWE